MSDMAISNSVRPLAPLAKNSAATATPKDGSFGQIVSQAISEVNQKMNESADAVEALTSGASRDIHSTMIAMEKASISFQMLNQVRNKVVEAYKEIQRMSI